MHKLRRRYWVYTLGVCEVVEVNEVVPEEQPCFPLNAAFLPLPPTGRGCVHPWSPGRWPEIYLADCEARFAGKQKNDVFSSNDDTHHHYGWKRKVRKLCSVSDRARNWSKETYRNPVALVAMRSHIAERRQALGENKCRRSTPRCLSVYCILFSELDMSLKQIRNLIFRIG